MFGSSGRMCLRHPLLRPLSCPPGLAGASQFLGRNALRNLPGYYCHGAGPGSPMFHRRTSLRFIGI